MDFTAGYDDGEDLIAELMSEPVYAGPDSCHFCAGVTPARYQAEWKGRNYGACADHYDTFRQMLDGEAYATGYEFAHADLIVEPRPEIRPIGGARPVRDPERSGIPATLLHS